MWNPIWFALILTRWIALDNFCLPRFWVFFHYKSSKGLWLPLPHKMDLWKLVTHWIFNRFATFWYLKLFHNLKDRAIFLWDYSYYCYFSIFNQTLKFFWTPCTVMNELNSVYNTDKFTCFVSMSYQQKLHVVSRMLCVFA